MKLFNTGKVRESYLLDDDTLLFLASDRFSAFDVVLGTVPHKGQVLNQLAAWWFDRTADIIPNHKISLPGANALIGKKTEPLPIEIIVRGYLTGVSNTSLWYRYSLGERNIYGYQLPDGLKKNHRLPVPLITPTTKGGPTGHDERLTCAEVTHQNWLDHTTWDTVQKSALALFERGQQLADKAGLVLVDTKYEFGRLPNGEIILIDEIHTPDSSRFWKKDHPDKNFDKEWIRLMYAERGYRGNGTPPTLDDHIWTEFSQRCIAVYEMLTGEKFVPGEYYA